MEQLVTDIDGELMTVKTLWGHHHITFLTMWFSFAGVMEIQVFFSTKNTPIDFRIERTEHWFRVVVITS